MAPSSIDFVRSARIRASSSFVGARSSAPITQERSVPWPTNEHTLIAGFTRSTASAYSPKDDQVRFGEAAHRRRRAPTVSAHDERHAHVQRAFERIVHEHRLIRMRMDVDE